MKRIHYAEQDTSCFCHTCNKAYGSDRALKIHKSKDISHKSKVAEAHAALQPALAATSSHGSGIKFLVQKSAALCA